MRFGSVCSGIEAASVAWHSLGWEASWLAEVDVAASLVLAHRLGATAPQHMPSPYDPGLKAKEVASRKAALSRITREKAHWGNRLVNWGDFTRLPDAVRCGAADAPDVLCGGTPCQSYSIAGRREGLEDSRGQLTLKFVELADAIDEKRAERGEQPCVVFWENVLGVLSSKDNAFGCFLADLAGEDMPLQPSGTKWTNAGVVLGPKRAVAWVVKDAQYFGLAQRRSRVFVVASAREGFDPAAVLFEFDGVRRDTAPSREAREDVTHALAPCLTSSGRGVERTGDTRGQDPVVACYRPRHTDLTYQNVAHCLNAGGMGRIDYETESFVVSVALRGREGGATAELGDEVAGTLRASGGGGDKPHVLAFSCKDYGADATSDLAPTMRAMGHDGSHANAGGQLAVCVTGSVTHTLTAEGFDASEDGTGRGQPIVPAWGIQTAVTPKFNEEICFTLTTPSPTGGGQPAACMDNDMAVRRLIPMECERLQGFDDDWTLVPVGKGFAADGPRYKQLGNSWAVPCVRWIGGRIAAHIAELDARQSTDVDPFITWLLAA